MQPDFYFKENFVWNMDELSPICLPLLDIYEKSHSRFTYKPMLLANFSSCSLNERSLHFAPSHVNVCCVHGTAIDKKMLSPVLFVIAMLHCHSSPSFKDSLSADEEWQSPRV